MIHGKDIIIYEGDENPVAIAASKSCTVDKVAGTIETSSPASGVARSYASGRTDWVATLNNLVLSVKDYMLRVGETYYLTIGVRGSSTDTISGYAICTECNVTGTVGNLAQGSFRFQGSDREGTIPPQPGETGYDMTEDQVTAIVYNVVGDGYLSRLHNDTAQGLITFNAGAYIPVGQYLRIGDAYLTYDAEYGMLKVWDGSGVVERGLYATGSVSALGAASGGGGGGGGGGDMDRDSMFAILSGAPASASEWINAKFLKLGPGLAASNDGTLTITGAVTSVGLTMPTGFTVSGSPVTSSGVIAVSLATGYKLLTSSTATPGTYTKVTVDTYGRVTSGSTLSSSDIPTLSYIPLSGSDSITGKLEPATSASYDLGASSYKWRHGYFSGTVYATTFNGNATSATKATQDGDGNTITSKYVTLDTEQVINARKYIYSSATDTPLQVKGNTNNDTWIAFRLSNDTIVGYFGVDSSKQPRFYDTSSHVILHHGNYSSILDSRYVNVTGDTMTGDLILSKNDGTIAVDSGSRRVGLSASNNGGVWDWTYGAWLIADNGTNTFLNIGNVGIGTTSPSSKLTVAGTITPSATKTYDLGTTSLCWRYIYGLWVGSPGGEVFDIGANNQYHIRINTNGNVGIGTTSPSQRLHVDGNILANGAVTALSDMRRKSPVSEVNTRIEDLANLPVFYYKWKMGYDDDMHIGTSAQEVQKLFPELVIGKEDLSVNYPVLGTTLGILNSRKLTSHEKEIKALKKENKALKERIKALEDRV